jgi:predicted kinase
MTSIMELNDLGKKFLRDELERRITTDNDMNFLFKAAIEKTNETLNKGDSVIIIASILTKSGKQEVIEFTKDHLKFREKI